MTGADAVLAAVPLLLGAVLCASGAGKARGLPGRAAGTALERGLGPVRAVRVLRAAGAAELAVGAALLAFPGTGSGAAATALGTGFLAYLGYARATRPEASCGCTAHDRGPIGVRAFARAGVVVAGGVAVLASPAAWWSAPARQPDAFAAGVTVGGVLLALLFADPGRWVRQPLRRLRLRLRRRLMRTPGPLPGSAPVAASVELLEGSLAWEKRVPVIRTGLLEHWDDDTGWRYLRYAGRDGGRAVSVVFALDAGATVDGPPPAIRSAVVREEPQRVPAAV